MRKILLSACALGVFLIAGQGLIPLARTAPAGKPVDFQREIRPLLSDNCFHCHGPDASSRMVNLRLDLKEEAFSSRKSGVLIVPGKPDESLLYKRIAEPRKALRMPPPQAHKELTQEQVSLVKRWIEEGAKWEEHWAWKAPTKQAPPAVKNEAWVRNAIDRFILARLESEGLSPAPPADKRTLIRRVALDLTGLPPKPHEVEQFLNDKSPDAYEKMVDRYFASPHYGEHRARYWLDAARYADTHGIHIDNYREMWPYRDWVIQAYNRNMPFDQFTLEQLAGDMLPNPTLDQRIATGFQRCNVTTNEAGIIEEEYEEIYAKDRADTVGAVWLGMTVGCATCHDHKFDPIKSSDFYALGAFFRNTTQHVYDENVYDTQPTIVVPRERDRDRWIALYARRTELLRAMDAMRATPPAGFAAWLAQRSPAESPRPLAPEDELYTADFFRLLAGNPGPVLGESPVPNREAVWFPEHGNKGIAVEDFPDFDAEKPFTVSTQFYLPEKLVNYTIASRRDSRADGKGWSLSVNDRTVVFSLTGGAADGFEFRTDRQGLFRNATWNHITVTYDGSRSQSGLRMYVNGAPMPLHGRQIKPEKLRGNIKPDVPLLLGSGLAKGAIADFRAFGRAVTETEARLLAEWPQVEAALLKRSGALSEEDKRSLLSYYLTLEDAEFYKLATELATLNAEAKEIADRGALTHVMVEREDQMPYAHVLFRGAYDQRRERVEAHTPSVLPPMPSSLPKNRLGLAKWLMSESNPMTARVTVNRMWQEIFGTGIVRTADDFGSQGEPPVNQALLDWMAIDFRESGWDMKRFYKQLLLSNTYQQASIATPLKLEKDPQNRLLSRGPRFRMDAELVRDYALAASGLLAPRIGGPSVKPYQPEGIWEAVAMHSSNTRFYQQDSGESLYRRSMYTFWKRSAPPPSMEIFNAPTRESCTVLRERTNTPLQALVTMNDPQFFEAARVLAQSALLQAPTFDERLQWMAQRLLARPLNAREQALAEGAFSDYRTYYVAHPDDARKMLRHGDSAPDPSLPEGEFAAYTMLANQLMNLDEVLNK
jgi:hypothetical protein